MTQLARHNLSKWVSQVKIDFCPEIYSKKKKKIQTNYFWKSHIDKQKVNWEKIIYGNTQQKEIIRKTFL